MTVPSTPRRQWTDQQIETEVNRIAAEQAGVPLDAVTPESRLVEDLEYDSLDVNEVVMNIEDTFDIKVSDELLSAQPPKSVGDILEIVKHLLTGMI
jgi:acyl carrier protein